MKKLTLLTTLLILVSCQTKTIKPTTVQISRPINVAQYFSQGKEYGNATQGEAATRAADLILEKGGNVFDAAIATAFTIFVERPQSTGLAGGGFMLIHEATSGTTYAVDFREIAPKKASEKMYVDKQGNLIKGKNVKGILSVGIPGNVAGILEIYEKFATLPLATLMQPAIDLAQEGFEIYPHLAKGIQARKGQFDQDPYAQSIFYKDDGTPKVEGDILVQKDLARVLQNIRDNGRKGFYDGWVAQSIVKTSQKHGGLLSVEDLSSYQVKWREPIRGTYKEYTILSMSPPSSGGVHIVQSLNILENFDLQQHPYNDPHTIHLISSALQQAFHDRSIYMGDTDFETVPISELVSKSYAKKIANNIPKDRPLKPEQVVDEKLLGNEPDETAHFSIMDRKGNAVSMTSSINYWLGSGVVVEGTGLVLNNHMADFAATPGKPDSMGVITSDINAVEPMKRPLSNMSPTIVLDRDQKPILSMGTPDGARIISCSVLVFLNYFEFDMELFDAISALRYHHQWNPDEIRVEAQGFDPDLRKALENMGYDINNKNYTCKMQAVAKEKNTIKAASDVRGEGMTITK